VPLTDDEYVARVEGAAASLRARNAAWLEAINHIKVPAVHEAVRAAGLHRPVLVGHSIGGVLATVYAAEHPARAVLNIDQPLLAGPFAEVLRSKKGTARQIKVTGHADASGTPEANQQLSVRRAEAVKEYLVSKGADPAMLTIYGQGSKDPANPADPLAPENRRVEIGR